MKKYFKLLLSDSSKVSSKRFIGIQSFYLIIVITIIALSLIETQLANLELLKQIEEHLFLIVIAAFFVTGSENIVKIIKSKNPPDNNSYYNNGYIEEPPNNIT